MIKDYILLFMNRKNGDEPMKSDATHAKTLPGVGPLQGIELFWMPTLVEQQQPATSATAF